MWLTAVLLGSMALEFLLLLILVLYSREHVRRSFSGGTPETVPWPSYPRACVIIPLTGNAPAIGPALESLLTQTYPNYDTILVTRDPDDPATPLVRELLSRHARVRHIVSGPTGSGSQKNHNILAGLKAVAGDTDILVFCDSTHKAQPNFLQNLVQPLVTGQAVITSGFHRINPGDARIATLGQLQTVLTLHLLHGFAFIALPWGGATAMLKTAFHKCGLAGVLKENVLDDFPMGQRLLRFGIRSRPVATAVLNTDLTGQTARGWETWVTRQLLYLKYCLPGTWLGAALVVWLLAGPILLAALIALGGLIGMVAPPLALVSLGFLAALTVLGAWCRNLVPEAIPLLPWLGAFYANIFMACWCYLKTWTTDIIAWRGISYRVTWGGRVKDIILKD